MINIKVFCPFWVPFMGSWKGLFFVFTRHADAAIFAQSTYACIIVTMNKVTQTEDGDDLLTVAEAARLVYLSADTIRRYSNDGKLATLRTPANHRRFRRSDVLALLDEQKVAS